MARRVGIDSGGQYFYLDTGEDAAIAFENGLPYDYETGEDVLIVIADDRGEIIQDISSDVKDVLVAIFGNENQIPPARTAPPQAMVPQVTSPRISYREPPQQSGGGLFSGGKFTVSTETLALVGLFVLIFVFGKSRGTR